MKNSEALIIVEKLDGFTYPKKDLLALGLTSMNIKTLVSKGLVVYNSRNSYTFCYDKTKAIRKRAENKNLSAKEAKEAFRSFYAAVIREDYIVAYFEFKKYIELSSKNDFTLAFSLLLEYILADKNYDFSFIDKETKVDYSNSFGYVYNFCTFLEKLLKKDITSANYEFKKFKDGELKELDENTEYTLLVEVLLNDALKTREARKNKALSNSLDVFKEYDKLCDESYEKALDFIGKHKQKTRISLLFELTKTLISLSTNKKFVIGDKSKILYQSDVNANFRQAILINDFNKALYFAQVIRLKSEDKFEMDVFIKRLEEAITLNTENKNNRFIMNISKKEIIYNEKQKEKENAEKESYYNELYNLISLEKYDEVVNLLEENDDKYREVLIDSKEMYLNIIYSLINLRLGKSTLQEFNYDYKGLDHTEKFMRSIQVSDYRSAITYVKSPEVVLYSKVLEIYRIMLERIEKALANPKKVEQSEKYVVNNPQKKVILSDKVISDYITSRRYGELYNLLLSKNNWLYSQRKKLSRYEYVTLSILRIWNDVNNGTYREKNYEYLDEDNYKNFYDSLHNRDLYGLDDSIDRIWKSRSNFENISYFKQIIDDIFCLKESKRYDSQIKNIISKPLLTVNDYEELKNIYLDKLQDEKHPSYYYIIELVDMILIAKQNIVDDSYFENLEPTSENLIDKLKFCLDNGCYPIAWNLIEQIELKKNFNEIEFDVIKKLLLILKSKMHHYEKKEIVYKEDEKIDGEYEHLLSLEKFIQKEDYYGAYQFALNHQVSNEIYFELILPYIDDILREKELYENYKKAIETKDRSVIKKSIEEYSKFINSNSLLNKKEIEKRYKRMK